MKSYILSSVLNTNQLSLAGNQLYAVNYEQREILKMLKSILEKSIRLSCFFIRNFYHHLKQIQTVIKYKH